jgi:hypothetical protein
MHTIIPSIIIPTATALSSSLVAKLWDLQRQDETKFYFTSYKTAVDKLDRAVCYETTGSEIVCGFNGVFFPEKWENNYFSKYSRTEMAARQNWLSSLK